MKIVREPSRVIASVFSLCAFLVATVAGWRAGASTASILTSSIVAMSACHAIGLWAGWAGEKAVKEFLEQYQAARPVANLRTVGGRGPVAKGRAGEAAVETRVKKRAA